MLDKRWRVLFIYLDPVLRGWVSPQEVEMHTTMEFLLYFCQSRKHPVGHRVIAVDLPLVSRMLTVAMQQDRNTHGS